MAARSRLLLVGTAAGLVLFSGAAVGAMAPEPGVPGTPTPPTLGAPVSVTLGTEAEAWYQLTRIDTCTSPVGCLPSSVPALPALPDLPVDPTVFPADTLHVGWAGGVEIARTYLRLERSALPKGAIVIGGTLEVPFIADPASGTVLAESAGVKACLVTTSITDGVAGGLSEAPGMDCSVSSPLALEGDRYAVDLTPFIEAWRSGTADEGIALTPFTSSSFTSAWGLAVPGRNAVGLPHIEAELTYVKAKAAVPPVVAPAAPAAPAAPVVQAPVQSVVPGAAAPEAQVPTTVRRPQQTLLAAGTSPLGWVVLGLGLLSVLALGLVAVRPPEQPL